MAKLLSLKNVFIYINKVVTEYKIHAEELWNVNASIRNILFISIGDIIILSIHRKKTSCFNFPYDAFCCLEY